MKNGMTGDEIINLGFEKLLSLGEFDCACGRRHAQWAQRVTVDYGAVSARLYWDLGVLDEVADAVFG